MNETVDATCTASAPRLGSYELTFVQMPDSTHVDLWFDQPDVVGSLIVHTVMTPDGLTVMEDNDPNRLSARHQRLRRCEDPALTAAADPWLAAPAGTATVLDCGINHRIASWNAGETTYQSLRRRRGLAPLKLLRAVIDLPNRDDRAVALRLLAGGYTGAPDALIASMAAASTAP